MTIPLSLAERSSEISIESADGTAVYGAPYEAAALHIGNGRLQVRIWDEEDFLRDARAHASGIHVVLGRGGFPATESSEDRLIAESLRQRLSRGGVRLLLDEEPIEDQQRQFSDVAVRFRGGLPPGALRRVREYVTFRLGEKIELAQMAQIAGLSVCHFSRAFKQSMGLPPHRYLMRERVEAAARLIRDSDRTLAEISLEVGFSDQSHFTRCFAELVGSTPRDYRRNYR